MASSVCAAVGAYYGADKKTARDSFREKCALEENQGDNTCAYFEEVFAGIDNPTTPENTNMNAGVTVVYADGCSSANGCGDGPDSNSGVTTMSVPTDIGSSYGAGNEVTVSGAYEDICKIGAMYGCVQ